MFLPSSRTFLAFTSVTLVVMMTAVLISITNKFPVVILMLSENVGGEIDLCLTPGDWNEEFSINATSISEILAPFGVEVSLSSTFSLCSL